MATRYKSTNPRLPEGVIYVILSRLPVKSLLPFRTVCRSWLSIISSRDFIKTHLSISTHDPHLTHHRLIVIGCLKEQEANPSWLHYWTCSVHSLHNKSFTDTLWNKDLCPESIVGCCNGLVALKNSGDGHIFLWNPSTRKSRTLPKLDMADDFVESDYSFCYDEWNDDFKLFALSRAPSLEYKVSVYSLKSNCWRIIGDSPFGGSINPGKFAVGAIHWSPVAGVPRLVSLDIKTETYREILLPYFGEGEWRWDLGAFGESLSALCYLAETGPVDLWVTKDCAGKESWTKVFTIPYLWGIKTDEPSLKHICTSVNGDVMLQLDSMVLLYNSKDTTFKILFTGEYFKHLDVHTSVESLVSPHL